MVGKRFENQHQLDQCMQEVCPDLQPLLNIYLVPEGLVTIISNLHINFVRLTKLQSRWPTMALRLCGSFTSAFLISFLLSYFI